MTAATEIDDAQQQRWNGRAGRAWVEAQELLDHVFKPLEDLLAEAAVAGSATRVLDVGCGTGATTLAVAGRLGEQGHCVGIDISEPMLALARARAERERIRAEFICANAQHHAFALAEFDMIISRFGVMFFSDLVQAFANLRRAASRGAQLRCLVWRSPADNPFMTTAERSAAPLLPNLPAPRPDEPGQFALADAHRVNDTLSASGWTAIDLRPIDIECAFPESELEGYFTRLGPLGMILQDTDEPTRVRVIETVRRAFDPFVHGGRVRFTAACWLICARTPT